MTVPPELLEILVCPACRGRLVLTSSGQGLHCAACRVTYPVRDGIPVLITEDAVPDPSEPRIG